MMVSNNTINDDYDDMMIAVIAMMIIMAMMLMKIMMDKEDIWLRLKKMVIISDNYDDNDVHDNNFDSFVKKNHITLLKLHLKRI